MTKTHSSSKYGPKLQTLLLSLLAVVVILIYADTLTSPFIFDDLPNILDNPHIRVPALSFENLAWAGYHSPEARRPVANISFALNHYFNGYNPVGYHVVNILIHLACGIFLYFLANATLQTPALRSRYEKFGWIPFLAVFIWLVHPLQTQSVTYLVQRMNSMAAMFYVLSMLFYVKFRMSKAAWVKWTMCIGCVFTAFLAFGTKEITATLPLFIILYEWYFFQKLDRQWARRNFPLLGGACLLFMIIALVYLDYDPARILSGYGGRDFTPLQRLLTQSRVVIFYISLMLWPNPSRLNLDHDFAISYSLLNPAATLVAITVIIALIVFAILIARKEPLLSFSIIWFFGNLVIESSIIGLELVFEHRTYLPSMFVILAIAALVFRWLKHALPAVLALSLVGAFFCAWTYERNLVWADEITLYRDSAAKSPGKARPQNNLGAALSRQDRFSEAIERYQAALGIEPEYADAHYNLGYALSKTGKLDEGLAHFREAVRIKPKRVKYLNNLGVALALTGSYAAAIGHLEEALKINPSDADAHNNLGLVFKKQGDLNAAMQHFSSALALDPRNPAALNNRGVILMDSGQLEVARKHFARALEISPAYEEARINLEEVNKRMGNGEGRQNN
ncbi:MAG: tetratricopeptide repeat protein [Desulfobacteraceae bacterium]|jgi:tetratricopeptide (TPR) repeat protein|nr:tetratricopeptide repeat protein [Desulfobacteraceae bacterium]